MPTQLPPILTFLMMLIPDSANSGQAASAVAPWVDAPTILVAFQASGPKGIPSRIDAQVIPAQAVPPTNQAASNQPGAEQVTLLHRAIESAESRIAELKADLESPESEYAQAQAEFDKADQLLEQHNKSIDGTAGIGDDIKAETERLTKARNLAKERFDLAIENRRVATEQLATLQQKLKSDRQTLDRMEGREPPAEEKAAAKPAEPEQPQATEPEKKNSEPRAAETADTKTTDAAAAAEPEKTEDAAEQEKKPEPEKQPEDKELVEAKADAVKKAQDSEEAETEARSLTERLETLDKDITLEGRQLETARRQRDNAAAIREQLTSEFRKLSLEGASKSDLDTLLTKVQEAERRLQEIGEDVKKRSQLLEELHVQRSAVQSEQITALQKAEAAREQVRLADDALARLKNPLSPRNILNWLMFHGPSIVAIMLAMLIGHQLSKVFSHRVILLLARDGARGSKLEREARARTLIGVFHNTASLAIFLGGGMMILQESGIPIAPLLGGAAVFGLAVAFGAQNLIRDYFYGFVILLENQYKLNDVVKIGSLAGQVENITLRMTVLRDLEGSVHFIPNGQISSVTNMTHGWSRAVFDIAVAYKENVDSVIAVLTRLAAELRQDPVLGPSIMEDPTMLGVDKFDESSVVIKFFIKTRPLQQWAVKRELLRRIKNRFDELGIEIPFPYRTLVHRIEPGTAIPGESIGQPSSLRHEGHLLWAPK